MTEEFDFLRGKKRPEVVSALADAAAEGEPLENAEYIYRKKQLREIDRRLRSRQAPRHRRHRRPARAKAPRRVFFGATVTIENDEGETVTYRIVGADETGATGDISWRSPSATRSSARPSAKP